MLVELLQVVVWIDVGIVVVVLVFGVVVVVGGFLGDVCVGCVGLCVVCVDIVYVEEQCLCVGVVDDLWCLVWYVEVCFVGGVVFVDYDDSFIIVQFVVFDVVVGCVYDDFDFEVEGVLVLGDGFVGVFVIYG